MSIRHSKQLARKISDVVPSNNGSRIQGNNTSKIKNVTLIWLDNNINENNAECQDTFKHLRTVIDNITAFTDGEKCIQFLKAAQDKKIYMIISGSLGKHIVPRVHNLHQVDSIFIFCCNQQYHEQWARDWQKIRNVCTDIQIICDMFKQLIENVEQTPISFSILTAEDEASISTSLERVDPMFVYMQVIKEILLMTNYKGDYITDFINYCRELFGQDIEQQLQNVKLFERDYYNKKPMWWFTKQSFLYLVLNKAIRLLDIDTIMKIGFFVKDLQLQINDLYPKQFSHKSTGKEFIFYHTDAIFKEEYEQIYKARNGLISFHSFLFASTVNPTKHSTVSNPDLINVLFVMTIGSNTSTVAFVSAAIENGCNDKENEILFGMQTMFRIRNIKTSDDNPNLPIIELELTRNDDKEFELLTNHIREKTFADSKGWERLGLVLLKLYNPKQAQKIYQVLLEQETKEKRKAWIYSQLGTCQSRQKNHLVAIDFYEKSTEIYKKYSPYDSTLIASYNNIGKSYYKINNFEKAISYHEKVLLRQQVSLSSPCHPDLAETHHNIGLNYFKLKDYKSAVSSFEQALRIGQLSIAPNHPELAVYYNAIGQVYYKLNDYAKAFPYYEKALIIQKRSSSNDPANLAIYYHNIGTVYYRMKEYDRALLSHKEASKIQRQLSPSNDFDLALSYYRIYLVYENMKDYSNAYFYCEKAVKIGKELSLENNPSIQQWINDLARIKTKR